MYLSTTEPLSSNISFFICADLGDESEQALKVSKRFSVCFGPSKLKRVSISVVLKFVCKRLDDSNMIYYMVIKFNV